MPNICETFILRAGTDAIEAYIRMESDAEIVEVSAGSTEGADEWEAAF